mgnify:CR=1 FL=1
MEICTLITPRLLQTIKPNSMKKNTTKPAKAIPSCRMLLLVLTFISKNSAAANFFSDVTSKMTMERPRIWINATDSSTEAFSQTLFGCHTDAAEGYDAGLGGAYFNDGARALISSNSADRYNTQSCSPNYNINDCFPFRFLTNHDSYFTFSCPIRAIAKEENSISKK